ncbi:hypothetical protein Tco_1088588 [Tanacetum coccineum]
MYAEVFGIDVPLTQSQPTELPKECIGNLAPLVSLAEHKSREEQEARENVELVNKHLASVEIEKMVEESKNVIDVQSLGMLIKIFPALEAEEITNEVYELKRREKGKIVEESRSTSYPTPIRSPRIHTDFVSSDIEKLRELTETYTTPSSSSLNTKLSTRN